MWSMGALAIVIAAGVGQWFYGEKLHGYEPNAIPTILAETGPQKVRPMNEGGPMIPYQGIFVYGLIDHEGELTAPERVRD